MTLPIEWEFDIVRARHSTMLHTTSSCLVHKNRRRTWTDRCHYKNINLRTRRLAVLNKNLVLPPWYFSEAIFSTSNNHYTTHPLSRNILEGIQIIAYQKMLSVSLVYDPTETLQTWPYTSFWSFLRNLKMLQIGPISASVAWDRPVKFAN